MLEEYHSSAPFLGKVYSRTSLFFFHRFWHLWLFALSCRVSNLRNLKSQSFDMNLTCFLADTISKEMFAPPPIRLRSNISSVMRVAIDFRQLRDATIVVI